MFIVYVDVDEDGETCKPYTGREYHEKKRRRTRTPGGAKRSRLFCRMD